MDTTPSPEVPASRTRRFEYVGGRSSKYWAITVVENSVVVHHGRIGTKGIFSTTAYISSLAAKAAGRTRIEEKMGKGYREVPVQMSDLPLGTTSFTPLGPVVQVDAGAGVRSTLISPVSGKPLSPGETVVVASNGKKLLYRSPSPPPRSRTDDDLGYDLLS